MTRFSFSTLRLRLLLLVLIAVIPAVGLIYYTASRQREQVAHDAQEDSLRVVRAVSAEHERLIESGHQLLVGLAKLPQVLKYDSNGCGDLFSGFIGELKAFTTLAAAKPNGEVFCSGTPSSQPVNFSDRPYFQQVLRTRDFTVSDFVIGRLSKKPVITLSYPSLDDRGNVRAVLVMGLDLSWFHRIAGEARLPEGSSVTVIDSKGVVLARNPDPENLTGKSAPEAPIVKIVLARGEGTTEATGLDRVARLYAFTSLRGLSKAGAAYVWAGIPKEKAFADVNRILAVNLAGLGFVIVLTLVLGWTGSDIFVLRRINALVSTTKRLTAGDLNARAGGSYDEGELGELARSFDEMADSLEQRRDQLHRVNRALRTISECNQILVRAADEAGLLNEICRVIIEVGGYRLAWVGYAEQDEAKTVRPVAHAGDKSGYVETANITWADTERGCGPTGTAIRTGKPCTVNDVLTEPTFAPWRAEATARGYASSIALPLTINGQPLGALNIYATERDAFDAEEEKLLSELAADLSYGITSARMRVAHQQAEGQVQLNLERVRALHEIDMAITSTLDLRTTLDVLLEKIDRFLPYAVTTVRLLNRQTGELESFACRNLDEREWKEATARSRGGLARMLPEDNAPVVVRNAQTDPRALSSAFVRKHGLVSSLRAPLTAKGEVLGVLTFFTKEEHEFTNDEIEFLTTLAGQAAIAIHNSQLYEQTKSQAVELEKANKDLRKREEVQKLLKELSQDITTLDLDSLLKKLTKEVTRFLGVDISDVRVLVKGGWQVMGISGIAPELVQSDSTGTSRGRSKWVIKNRKPLLIPDITQQLGFSGGVSIRKAGIRGYLAVPLFSRGGEVIGLLRALNYRPKNFSREEVGLLEQLANGAAIAIHNARLYEQTKSQAVALEKSNKVKDEFLSVMSHELRTPLNVVMGYVSIVKDGMLGEINQKQREALNKVIDRSEDLLRMITEILQATSMDAKAVKVESCEVNLGDFLDDLRSDCELPLNKKVSLIWDYPPDLPVVRTDSDKLKHIIQNLIYNAIKFTAEGQVTVTARYLKGEGILELKVADTGVGIPAEALPLIFERFRQIDSSETRPFGGVGMGLYIVKKFTELLGGKVEVESEPGRGSTFIVTIPYKRVETMTDEFAFGDYPGGPNEKTHSFSRR